MIDKYKYYIIKDGVRIGFYETQEDAKEAMNYCKEGYITSKTQWEETQ